VPQNYNLLKLLKKKARFPLGQQAGGTPAELSISAGDLFWRLTILVLAKWRAPGGSQMHQLASGNSDMMPAALSPARKERGIRGRPIGITQQTGG
jgi:hypothetical protein